MNLNVYIYILSCNLQELFEEFGPVVEVRILGKGVRTPPGTGRAPLYAFIIFETSEAAEAALNKKVQD